MGAAAARTGPLAGVRVVEWGEHVSAPYAARLLADLGADVVKVEGPAGDPARRHGPFPGDRPDPEASGLFHALNFNKRGVVLDLDSPRDAGALEALLARCDVLLTNRPLEERRPRSLDGPSLLERHPRLVAVSVTAFGDAGPLADAPGCSLTSAAFGGASWAIGLPGRPPLTLPFDLADYEGGANAAAAGLAALLTRLRGAGGQTVDVAVADVIASFVSANALIYVNYGKPWRRDGRRASGSGGPYPYTILPCRDGYVSVIGRSRRDWESILEAMGRPGWASDPRFQNPWLIAAEHADEADALIVPWLTRHTRAELLAIARAHGFALAPVLSIAEVLAEPQLRDRAAFTDPIPVGQGRMTPLAFPYLFSRTPPARPVRGAPRLGEHTVEVLAEVEFPSKV